MEAKPNAELYTYANGLIVMPSFALHQTPKTISPPAEVNMQDKREVQIYKVILSLARLCA